MDVESLNLMAGLDTGDRGARCRPRMSSEPRRRHDITRKWPFAFWAILKVLGLYHHRVVVANRKCYLCKVRSRVARLNLLRISDPECGCVDTVVGMNVDQLILAYESDTEDGVDGCPSRIIVPGTQTGNRVCEACAAQWWNSYGVPVVYTEKEIGVTYWNHRGSGLLSLTLILLEISVLCFNAGYPIYSLWGKSDQILQLILKMSLICLLSLYPILACFAKIRSSFHDGIATKLAWATVLNVRYLIKRGQFLNMPRKGLPGKPFLFLCLVFPTAIASYRSFIFLHLGSCDVTVYTLVTSLVGVFFMETWSLFVYILYFVRVSFQCQFNLQLTHVRKEGEARERRAALFDTAADFSCFKQLVDLFTALTFPCTVFAIVSSISFDYLLGSGQTTYSTAEFNFAILAWIQIGIAIFLYSLALGGIQVGYVWENFLLNLLHSKGEGECSNFWQGIFKDLKHFNKSSNILLTTIICSVIGIYMGMGISDQAIAEPSMSCNTSNSNILFMFV